MRTYRYEHLSLERVSLSVLCRGHSTGCSGAGFTGSHVYREYKISKFAHGEVLLQQSSFRTGSAMLRPEIEGNPINSKPDIQVLDFNKNDVQTLKSDSLYPYE
ncbi:uncharacterized protein LOC114934691 isoform X2 [Nylanderia fulva]|uniref:uncharacterized protein LOC114934691 isoform X2 n=1 Tax=Nylanderia fulva TaxID=613905 RepID=UPI0010FB6175|nr:uncharacterized protein LOC114934691 isoform X2 [Nylanderia fulva]